MRQISRLYIPFICLLLLAPVQAPAGQSAADALRDYVTRPDDSYRWTVRHRSQLGACEVIELTLTSQTWRDLRWQHRLFLIVPPNLPAQTDALLVIEGGSWKDSDARPLKPNAQPFPKQAILMATYAQQLNSPIAVILNVPRQPIFDGKKEDAIIALTFDRFLETGERDWPLLLPMVKSAVRGMDAIQAFAADELKLKIDSFTVTGASKRGWTTWLTAAVDPRVRALGPMVIDMLNLEVQFEHQQAAYGKLSERIHDYTDRNLHQRMRGKAGEALRRIVDPYEYRDQITQPKMLFLGTNDGFWTLDSLNLYFDQLKGEKYIVYVPNADHDLAMDWRRVLGGLKALHEHAHGRKTLPQMRWRYEAAIDPATEDQPITLRITPGAKGARVHLWTAEAATRDFRSAQWTRTALNVEEAGDAIARVTAPASGYRAMFAEVVYSGGLMPLHLSTTIHVLPPATGEQPNAEPSSP